MKQQQMTGIAVGCGLACALCVGAFMANVQGQADAARAEALARYGGEQVEVCVATRDIAAGERLDMASVDTRLWVADLLPDEALQSSGDAVGKVATSSILRGEVISAKRFESGRDSLDVPAGKQAVSVPAKAVQAVGGAVRPGMSVDVYTASESGATAIALGVVVLDTSVGESGSLVSSDAGWVTLAIDAQSVQEVIAASSKSTLYFTIPGDQVDQGARPDQDNRSDLSGEASVGAFADEAAKDDEGVSASSSSDVSLTATLPDLPSLQGASSGTSTQEGGR